MREQQHGALVADGEAAQQADELARRRAVVLLPECRSARVSSPTSAGRASPICASSSSNSAVGCRTPASDQGSPAARPRRPASGSSAVEVRESRSLGREDRRQAPVQLVVVVLGREVDRAARLHRVAEPGRPSTVEQTSCRASSDFPVPPSPPSMVTVRQGIRLSTCHSRTGTFLKSQRSAEKRAFHFSFAALSFAALAASKSSAPFALPPAAARLPGILLAVETVSVFHSRALACSTSSASPGSIGVSLSTSTPASDQRSAHFSAAYGRGGNGGAKVCHGSGGVCSLRAA